MPLRALARPAVAALLWVFSLMGCVRSGSWQVVVVTSTHSLDGATRAMKTELQSLAERRGWDLTFLEPEADSDPARLHATVVRLIETQRVDVVVAVSTSAARAAARAAERHGIPLVFLMVSDPVAAGLVRKLVPPGGLVTGVMDSGASLAGKRLELLTRAHSGVERVLVPHARGATSAAILDELETNAAKLGVELVTLPVGSTAELDEAYARLEPGTIDAIYVPSDVTISAAEASLADAVSRLGVPTIVGGRYSRGATFGYGTAPEDAGKWGASLVGKILDGIPVGDLPVLDAPRPVMRLFAGNAERLGYEVSEAAFWLADEIIE